MGKKLFAVLSVVALAISMLAVPVAQAAEVTRESYKEAVEPTCKRNTKANERILKGVRAKFNKGKLKAAAQQFAKAGRALKKTVKQLRAVEQPVADKAKLAKWLKYVQEEANLFQRASKKLKQGNKNAAQKMVLRLTSNARRANNLVVAFEFRYCVFEPSKFT